MKTNWSKILGIILMWAIFIGNTNIVLSNCENLLVGAAAWLIAQEREVE